MAHTPQPLTPIMIHPQSWIERLDEDKAARTFFCLDNAEFGDRLSSKVAEIRKKAGVAVPIVVVGAWDEQRQVSEEANRVVEAGAIYFKRPSRDTSISELADTIVKELTRILDSSGSFSRDEKSPGLEALPTRRNTNEQAFYVDAPFRLSEDSLENLLHRLEMSDTDPRKDD